MATIVKCPTCRRDVEWSAAHPYRPFCSDRCRLIDLGAWFCEQRVIPDDRAEDGAGDDAGADEDAPPPQ
ncbi:MAG TPA: DNA gyrase inhibitor YacG [Steroidobacteraceae bacterium]|nr:DNA gyrase inhibitor YacG [Steroidobacteraceae bacterium]